MNLSGVVPAIITPFSSDGEFNEAAFRTIMEANIRAGVHGFWIGGGSGESVALSDDENYRVALAAAEQGNARVTNIMHVGAPTTKRAARMAERAAQAGVDALCCVPPFFYEPDERAIVEHYRVVAEVSDLPLLLYNLPQSTNVTVTPELAQRIRDRVPKVVGLKHSGVEIEHTHEFAKHGFACFIGRANMMLPGMTLGAIGCIDGPLAVAPEAWVEIWKHIGNGDLTAAIQAQDRASAIANAIYSIGFLDALKAACSARYKIDCGTPRAPQLGLENEQEALLVSRLRSLGVIPE